MSSDERKKSESRPSAADTADHRRSGAAPNEKACSHLEQSG